MAASWRAITAAAAERARRDANILSSSSSSVSQCITLLGRITRTASQPARTAPDVCDESRAVRPIQLPQQACSVRDISPPRTFPADNNPPPGYHYLDFKNLLILSLTLTINWYH